MTGLGRSPPVITRLQGGLGNQLYQYAVGRALALSMRRPLLVDARTILPEAPARHFDLGAFALDAGLVSGLAAFCTRWVGSVRVGRFVNATFPPARSYRYIRDRGEGFDRDIFLPHEGPIVLHGYWQCFKYFEDIREQLLRDLHFRHTPDAQNAETMCDIRSCTAVCVHVRRGDYVANPEMTRILGTCDEGYYERAAQVVTGHVSNPRFFVFSDDPEWARRNLRLPGETVVVEHNVGKSDVDDLRLMRCCSHFIIANSSFSWWGAWLSGAPGKVVVAPARWFRQDRCPPEDRIPSSWFRV